MFHNIQWRIAIPFVLLVLVSTGILGFYLVHLVSNTQVDNLRSQLENEAKIIAQVSIPLLTDSTKQNTLDELAKTLGKQINARVTIIAQDGVVLGDSESNPATMENHANRPEVIQALATGLGESTRYSATLKEQMLYVAVPIGNQGQASGVARVALPLTAVESSVNRLITTVALSMAITAGLAIIAALVIARIITQPIKQVTKAAQQVASGELGKRVFIQAKDESGKLANAFNEMSVNLKEMVTTISAEKSKLATILSSMVDGLIMTDAEGRIVLANGAAERLFSFDEAKVIGQYLIEVVRDHEIDEILKSCLNTRTERTNSLEFGISKRFLRVVAVPLMAENITGAIIVFQDLSEMRSLQTMRQEFVANVSHELRTPLAGIKAIVETLRDGGINDKEAAKRFLARVDTEVDRMTQIVAELAELSRIESGRGELKSEEFNLNAVVQEVVSNFHPQSARQEVTLSTELFADLPLISADRDRIYQAITNLVHNAIKFTSTGGKITVSTKRLQDSVSLEVSDTGRGISAEDLPRIFERFYKADKARSGQGTGLGLAIAKHIVQAHGGKIWVESKEGKGSTFGFSLPLQVTSA